MRLAVRVLILGLCTPLVLTALLVRALAAQAGSRSIPRMALVDVNVVDVENGVVTPHQTVIVAMHRIEWVGPHDPNRLRSVTTVVPASGKYVIPGLWDMHVHVSNRWPSGQTASGDSARRFTLAYFRALFLSTGVTGVRDLGGHLADPQGAVADWREGGPSPVPRVLMTGRKLGSGPVVPGAPFPLRSPDDARRSVALLHGAGAHQVKLGRLPANLHRAALDECVGRAIPCVAHVPTVIEAAEASVRGVRSFEHLLQIAENTSTFPIERVRSWQLEAGSPTALQATSHRLRLRAKPKARDWAIEAHDTAKAGRLFRDLARNGTWVTPTLVMHDIMLRVTPRDPVAREIGMLIEAPTDGLLAERRSSRQLARARREYEFVEGLVRRLRDTGVGILAGTDTPLQVVAGRALHYELTLLQRSGLSPLEALRTATVNPARYLGATDTLGVIRAGAAADLVVLRANPLADVNNTRTIEMVVAQGHLFRRNDLDTLRESARRALIDLRRLDPLLFGARPDSLLGEDGPARDSSGTRTVGGSP